MRDSGLKPDINSNNCPSQVVRNALIRIYEINQFGPLGLHLIVEHELVANQIKTGRKIHSRWRESCICFENGPIAAFPSNLGDETGADFEYFPGCVRPIRMRHGSDKRRNKFRLHVCHVSMSCGLESREPAYAP